MVKITRFTLPHRKNPIFKSSKEFEIQKSLGSGGFSVVYEGLHKKTNKKYALKIIDFDRLGTLDQENIQKEIEAHKNFNHPYIIKLHDFFQEQKKVYLILELCKNGNLFDHILKITKFQQIEIQKIIKQTFQALNHIHKKGYIMRDIKPENLLIDSQNNIKLCDFGWTASLTQDENYRKVKAGTFAYMSPESLLGELQDIRSDIWSMGILLFELFHLKEPYSGISCQNQLKLIRENPVKFDYNLISRNGIDLVRKLLRFDREKRPGIEEILKSEFFREELVFDKNFKNEKIKEDFLKDIGKNHFFDKKKMEAKKQKGIDEIMGKYNVNIKRNNSVSVITKKPINNIQISLVKKENRRDFSHNGKKFYANKNHYFSTKNILEKTKNYMEDKNYISQNLYNKNFANQKNDNIYQNLYNTKINSLGSTKKIISSIKHENQNFKPHKNINRKFNLEGKQIKKKKNDIPIRTKKNDKNDMPIRIKKNDKNDMPIRTKKNDKNKMQIKTKKNVKKYKFEKKNSKKYQKDEKHLNEIKLIEFDRDNDITNLYKKKQFRNSKSLPMKQKSNLIYKNISKINYQQRKNISKINEQQRKNEIKKYNIIENQKYSISEKKYKINIYPSQKVTKKSKNIINSVPSKKYTRRISLSKTKITNFNTNIINSEKPFNDQNTKSSSFLNNYGIKKKFLNKNYSTKYDLNSNSKKRMDEIGIKKKKTIENINLYESATKKKKNPPVKVKTSKLKSKKKIQIDFYKNREHLNK